jgi:hypothetical protein
VILESSHFGCQQVPADRIEAGILLRLIVDLLKSNEINRNQTRVSTTTTTMLHINIGERNQNRTKRDEPSI